VDILQSSDVIIKRCSTPRSVIRDQTVLPQDLTSTWIVAFLTGDSGAHATGTISWTSDSVRDVTSSQDHQSTRGWIDSAVKGDFGRAAGPVETRRCFVKLARIAIARACKQKWAADDRKARGRAK